MELDGLVSNILHLCYRNRVFSYQTAFCYLPEPKTGIMNFQSVVPILYTEELSATFDFYIRLGFHCDNRNDDWGWATLHRDACEIMLARPVAGADFKTPHFTGCIVRLRM